MHILLDTNIFFSALIEGGNEKYVLEKIVGFPHTLVVTDFIEEELKRVLSEKLGGKERSTVKTLWQIFDNPNITYRKTRQRYEKFLGKARGLINQKDAPILAAALQKEIDAMVTGDKDFLDNPKLQHLRKKKIFSSRELIPLL